ncbi:hypothetical protein B1M_35141, partial [Burkholderia sp. TJI49]
MKTNLMLARAERRHAGPRRNERGWRLRAAHGCATLLGCAMT